MSEEQNESRENLPFATSSQVKSIIRRKLRKQPEHEHTDLNIYPMMDMMTILLVFLIMQFAASSANITQSDQMQLPYSTSTQVMEDALTIQISANEVTVSNARVMSLRNGLVDQSQKQGGANGFLITPLFATMSQHRDLQKLIAARDPNRPFTGTVQVIADRRTRYRTLSEIIYTMGQAEFSKMHFVILQQAGGAS